MKCRHCGASLHLPLVDLGSAPPSNAYLPAERVSSPETWFPLKVLVCESCWLVQTADITSEQSLFDAEYAYFSSFSDSWLKHCNAYAEDMVQRFALDERSLVVEVAANDGYLLQYFKALGVPSLGVEPTASTAAAARAKGIEIVERFFGTQLARELLQSGRQADLMAANNVLAHVPDINDFVRGFALLLAPTGVATFEFPHLLKLLQGDQFDTIYHEHFSYLSLGAVSRIFAANGLQIFEVQELPTHGGSLRVFARRADAARQDVSPSVTLLLDQERAAGLDTRSAYANLQARAESIKNGLLRFLIECKEAGIRVGAYGAAAKGNTLLNFAGVRPDLLPYVVDRNPAKQGKHLPGSRIPIVSEEHLRRDRPDRILVLPWNLSQELAQQLAYVCEWGAQLVVAVPMIARVGGE